MNPQGSKDNPLGGIEWAHIFGPRSGYTANPVRGCEHDCKWRMEGDKIVMCYAKAQRERMDGPGSFEKITFHPEVLEQIQRIKKPCGIFIDSMADLFGQGVRKEWIDAVIDCIWRCPQHVFFSLTKNPSRFREFQGKWPENLLAGISAPPTFMFGKELNAEQQAAWLKRGLEFLKDSPAKKRWMSIEPLSFDVSKLLRESDCRLHWAVIGAGSDGAKTFQPNPNDMFNTLSALSDMNVPVFFKGNISTELAQLMGGWRNEFPVMKKPDVSSPNELTLGL